MRFTMLVASLAFALPVAAQAPDSSRQGADSSARSIALGDLIHPVPHRDPDFAGRLGSFVPGAGHIYAAEYFRGSGYFLGTTLMVGLGPILFFADPACWELFSSEDCDTDRRRWTLRLAGVNALAAGAVLWVRSAKDAPDAARRANARRRARITPSITPGLGPHGEWRVGANVNW